MESIAVIQPNMGVLPQNRLQLTPFGALAQTFAEEILARAQREDRVVSVSQELPKSFVVCRDRDGDRVYLSQLSPATLLRRAQGLEG